MKARSVVIETIPNMPARNRWLTDSISPCPHMNPAATSSVIHAGPNSTGAEGKRLAQSELQSVPTLFGAHPTVKKIGNETVVIASGTLGIQKILATGNAFDLVHFLVYPGFEGLARRANDRATASNDHARLPSDRTVAAPEILAKLNVGDESGVNGATGLIDKDGFHYCVYGGVNLLKTTDDDRPHGPLRIVNCARITGDMPSAMAKRINRVIGSMMTYDGFIALVAPGGLVVIDRDTRLKDVIALDGETIESNVAVDENGGIYVVTSRRMLKVMWTGRDFSTDPKDGAWECLHTATSEHSRHPPFRGPWTTPRLMGFGDDPHELVVVAEGDSNGASLSAFWRNEIPGEPARKTRFHSRRIADQVRVDIATPNLEGSLQVLGYGVAFLNGAYPKPSTGRPPGIAAVRRPPSGIQRFTWNPRAFGFERAWLAGGINNTDCMVPVISALAGTMYAAHRVDGDYQYLGIDWQTGRVRDRWVLPDDNRVWNAFGGMTTILENGDLMTGGVFAIKRIHVGDGAPPRRHPT